MKKVGWEWAGAKKHVNQEGHVLQRGKMVSSVLLYITWNTTLLRSISKLRCEILLLYRYVRASAFSLACILLAVRS